MAPQALAATLPTALPPLPKSTQKPSLRTIKSVSDLSATWLSSVLNAPVRSFRTQRIGTGQIGECHSIHLDYAAEISSKHDNGVTVSELENVADIPPSTKVARPASLVLKIAASDEKSRATGVALGFYAREVRFYTEIAPLLGDRALATCYHGSFDECSGTFCLLLADARPAVTGDEVSGATMEQAMLALTELGHLQAAQMEYAGAESPFASADWLNRGPLTTQAYIEGLWPSYLERYGSRISPEHKSVCETFIASFDAYHEGQIAPGVIRGLVHGDFRLDNMLFGQDGADRPFTAVDWQTVTWGPLMSDASYFLGCALSIEDRRNHGESLIRAYHTALGPKTPFSLEQVKENIRLQSFFGLVTVLLAPMILEQTPRGDDLFMAMMERHCTHVLDLEALLVLPSPVDVQRDLRPDPVDEKTHTPGSQPLWNESFYFDVADVEMGVGAWIRLGMTPNQPGSWYHALICGPNRPTVAVVDFEIPTPGDDLVVHTESIHATHTIETPMERAHVTLKGKGESFDNPATLLRGEKGRIVDVSLDLVWQTSGEAFKYQILTRYEIPCTVTGTITVDGEVIQFNQKAGQRDHSYGVRDWWSYDWVWSAFHLEDGSHLHTLDLRPHGTQSLSAGYIQGPKQPITDLTQVDAVEDIASNGIARGTKITIAPGNLVLDVEPIGHAPVRLIGKDGRVAIFPRSWAKITTSDGRKGVGWIEWNINDFNV